MTTQLLDGPGRTLECIHPKFMVDLVQGVDAARHPHPGPQQLQFRERLTQEINDAYPATALGDGGYA